VSKGPPRSPEQSSIAAVKNGIDSIFLSTMLPKLVKSSQVKSSQVKIGPLLITYLFSEGTYVSIYDVSPLDGPPPSSTSTPVLHCCSAGFRSTFDRLPYGCLLFMYRLDLT
jgi:hypothetical protein